MFRDKESDSDSCGDDERPSCGVNVSGFLLADYRRRDAADGYSSEEVAREHAVKKRRLKRQLCAAVVVCSAKLMEAYVKYRGGIQEIRNYDIPEKRFDPSTMCDKMFVSLFRFERDEVELLISALQLPRYIISDQRDRGATFEVFSLLCMKYAFPTRFCQMIREYGRSASSMSRLIKSLRIMLYESYSHALRYPPLLTPEECACFASAIRKVSGHPVIVGFVDGTVREICKPSLLQGAFYTGKDRIHALKYQAINTPDGLIRHLAGPYPGARHDQFMLKESKVLDWIGGFPRQQGTSWAHVIYADCGYCKIDSRIEVPYHDAEINVLHAAYNDKMSSSRISVEWAFGGILKYWSALRHVPSQQILSNQKIGQIYFVAALLTNLLNCVRPNQTSQYFKCEPPSLQAYLAWLSLNRK